MADNHVDAAGAGAGSSVKATMHATSSATDTSGGGGGGGSNGAASAAAAGDTEDVVMEPQPANDDGDDDNDSDDSDDSDDEVSEERVAELVAAVKAAPFDYGAHTSLVSAHRTNGDLFELRAARHAFADKLPLSEGAALPHRPMSAQPLTHTRYCLWLHTELWREWISDELRVADSAADHDRISKIFDKAVADYLNVSLWEMYAPAQHAHHTHPPPLL